VRVALAPLDTIAATVMGIASTPITTRATPSSPAAAAESTRGSHSLGR
jgi:hypothetical protein